MGVQVSYIRALSAADYIQADLKVLRNPAHGDQGDLDDEALAPQGV